MTQNTISFSLTMQNQRGLHARASAKFVKCAEQFPDTDIIVQKDGQSVSALSIMGLMMLAAVFGTDIQVTASGQNAQAAMNALSRLVNNKFDEES